MQQGRLAVIKIIFAYAFGHEVYTTVARRLASSSHKESAICESSLDASGCLFHLRHNLKDFDYIWRSVSCSKRYWVDNILDY